MDLDPKLIEKVLRLRTGMQKRRCRHPSYSDWIDKKPGHVWILTPELIIFEPKHCIKIVILTLRPPQNDPDAKTASGRKLRFFINSCIFIAFLWRPKLAKNKKHVL